MAGYSNFNHSNSVRNGFLILFLIAYFTATTVFQLNSDDPINMEGSPFDRMNGGLLWIGSSTALLNGVLRGPWGLRAAIWVLGSAAIGFVALDELFALHEHSVRVTGDDDDPKILLMLCALVGIGILNYVEDLNRTALWLFVAGLAMHFAYLGADLGDGDYFTLPVSGQPLLWIEEYLELAASGFYFSGLFVQAVWVARGDTSVARTTGPESARI